MLPLGEKTEGRGKWSARWEGPFIIHRILTKGAYHLRDLDGTLHPNPINGRFLKRHIVGVWERADPPHPPDAATIVHSAPRLRDSTPPPPTRGNLREKHVISSFLCKRARSNQQTNTRLGPILEALNKKNYVLISSFLSSISS